MKVRVRVRVRVRVTVRLGEAKILFRKIKLDGLLTLCVCSLCIDDDAAKRNFDETEF